MEIARENDLPIPEEIINGKSAEEIDDVYARCLRSQQLYLKKIELGKQVATIEESGKVMYEALGKIDKEAFDTETQTRSDFVLHKWQEDVMKFSNSSTERQVTRITTLGGETFF